MQLNSKKDSIALQTFCFYISKQCCTIKYESTKTDPNITITGTDENYLLTSGYKIAEGRNFSVDEINYGRHVIIIGKEVKNIVFGQNNAIGKVITVGSNKYKIIGILEKKGSSMGLAATKLPHSHHQLKAVLQLSKSILYH